MIKITPTEKIVEGEISSRASLAQGCCQTVHSDVCSGAREPNDQTTPPPRVGGHPPTSRDAGPALPHE